MSSFFSMFFNITSKYHHPNNRGTCKKSQNLMGQEDSPQLTGSSGSYGLSSNAVKELGGLHKMAKAPTSYMQT